MPEFNRNGAIGRYSEFAPIRLSMEEIVAAVRKEKPKHIEPPARVVELGDAWLVRYRLGSPALQQELDVLGANGLYFTDHPDMTSVFGVVDKVSGRVGAILAIYEEQGVPEIAFALVPADAAIKPYTMLEALKYLDVPASRRSGTDHQLASKFECWFSDDTWGLRTPRHVIAISFERICFSVEPALREEIDVIVLEDPDRPLDGAGDENAAYWNVDHYRSLGFNRLEEYGTNARPGFSSWSPKDVRRVKITGTSLDSEIEELEQARDAAAPAP